MYPCVCSAGGGGGAGRTLRWVVYLSFAGGLERHENGCFLLERREYISCKARSLCHVAQSERICTSWCGKELCLISLMVITYPAFGCWF